MTFSAPAQPDSGVIIGLPCFELVLLGIVLAFISCGRDGRPIREQGNSPLLRSWTT